MARQEPGYLSDMGQSGSASPAWPHGLRERNRPVCVGVSFLSQLSLFPNKYSSFQRDGSLRGQPFSPRSSTVLQGASGNFWGLFDCHSLGMGALWAFIRLGEGIRDDMFSALHNKKNALPNAPSVPSEKGWGPSLSGFGWGCLHPKDKDMTQSWPMR